MDDYSIKVISWIGISFVTTYRIVLLKPPERVLVPVERGGLISNRRERNEGFPCLPEPSTEQTLRNLIKQDTDNLMKWIRGDVQAIHKLMKGNDKKIPEWTKGETNTLYESMKFQVISFNRQQSLLTFQLIVVENLTTDQETLIKWVEENDKMCTVCSEEDKRILTEWISDNQQTITESISKDTMKHYNIVLSKTSNKNTMIEIGDRALCELGCPSALNITSTKVKLKWDEPSVGAEFIDFYKIMCEEKRICVTCFFETPGNSCTYVVEGLKPNTEYAFKIQAVKNGQNRGPFSNTLTVSTLEISCDREAELVALCEPGCPSALNITSTKVELQWDEPSVGAEFIDFL
ncbi:PTPRS [Mytilus edulis]|uniref:PTPRS n=1 Tax=Mytilus edulis TaxID=6550 RepID=A0A8S3V4Y3_MYTED|nr:PTPRS [Mytilus edulis]